QPAPRPRPRAAAGGGLMAEWPYSTARWQRLRAAKLRREPTCEYCRQAGRCEAAVAVDHRVAIRHGGAAWQWDNLVSACESCHNRKTRYVEQLGTAVPVKGCDPITGLPLDPTHPWHASGAAGNCSGPTVRDRRGTFGRT